MVNIDLTGKIAVITGASGQLGRVMARTLAQAGADIAVHYFGNRAKAEEIASEIRSLGVRSIAVMADVTDLTSVLDMRNTIRQQLGDPHIVVDSAVVQYDWKTEMCIRDRGRVLKQPCFFLVHCSADHMLNPFH